MSMLSAAGLLPSSLASSHATTSSSNAANSSSPFSELSSEVLGSEVVGSASTTGTTATSANEDFISKRFHHIQISGHVSYFSLHLSSHIIIISACCIPLLNMVRFCPNS
jgi:hypothetical protein